MNTYYYLNKNYIECNNYPCVTDKIDIELNSISIKLKPTI